MFEERRRSFVDLTPKNWSFFSWNFNQKSAVIFDCSYERVFVMFFNTEIQNNRKQFLLEVILTLVKDRS